MESFPLYGKEVDIPIELANFNVFRSKYYKMTEKTVADFTDQYKKKFSDIEQVIENCMDVYLNCLFSMVKAAIGDLITNKVFDIDSGKFLTALMKPQNGCLRGEKVLEVLEDKFIDIIDDQAKKNAYRTARRQGRSRVVGGGYGLGGAVKGMVTAGAINAGTGMVHGAANLVGSAFSSIGAGMKKASLFSDTNTFNDFRTALEADCHDVLFTLVNFLKNKVRIKAVSTADERNADILLENMSRAAFPQSEILDTAITMILKNPYKEDYYHFLISKFGDENMEAEKLGAFFHVDVKDYKAGLVKEHLQHLPTDTLENAFAAQESVDKFCQKLGGVPNIVRDEIEQLIETRKYERVYERYHAYPKNSIDEWSSCREQIESLCKEMEVSDGGEKILAEIDTGIYNFKCDLAIKFLHRSPRASEEEAIRAKKGLLEYCNEIDLEEDNPAIQEINGILKQIDIDIRTVEGYEFDTRDAAKKANADKLNIEAQLGGRQPVSVSDYYMLLKYMDDNPITPALEDIYRKRFNTALVRIAKLSKRAQSYELRKLKTEENKTLFKILAIVLFPIGIFLLIKLQLEKKAWEELTHNGQHTLSSILGTTEGMGTVPIAK